MNNNNRNPHHGSSFESFLEEQNMLEEVNATAAKRVLVWELTQAIENAKMTKSELAQRMRTSRAVVYRLFDPDNPSLNLKTMEKAAHALGKQVSIQLR